MPRNNRETATRRIKNFIANYPLLAERPFIHRFWNKLEHEKIKDHVLYVAGLLAFLVIYLLFLNFIIFARLSTGVFP